MQYRPRRYVTQYPVDLQTPTGQQRGRVVDVNSAGARIEGVHDLKRGDKLRLNILSLQADAIVQWVNGNRVGITFHPQISTNQVDILRYRPGGQTDGRRSRVGFGFVEMR